MTEYPPTSPVYAWPLLEGDQPNDWRHVDQALLAVEQTVEAVEALATVPDAVTSVNGETGAVVLDAADVGALTEAQGDAAYAAVDHTHPSEESGPWRFQNTPTVADPGAGNLRSNTGALATATVLVISRTTEDDYDIPPPGWGVTGGDTIFLQDREDSTRWVRYTADEPLVQFADYATGAVTVNASAGAIAHGRIVQVTFTLAGGGGGGAGAVTSVNGETGAVVLDAADVGALTQTAGDARYLQLTSQSHNHTAGDGSGVLSNEEHDGYSQYTNLGADPTTPTTNQIRLYAKDNGAGVATLYYRTESGEIYELPTLTSGGGGGSGAPSNASYITTTTENKLSQEKVLGTAVIMSGTLASRPAFGTAGRLYLATDTDLVYRDTGSAWETFATRASSAGGLPTTGGTMTGTINAQGSAVDSGGALKVTSPAVVGSDILAYGAGSPAWAPIGGGGTTDEQGLAFTVPAGGYLVAVRWYCRAAGQTAPTAARLWDSTSTATPVWTASTTADWTNATAGWKEHRLAAGTQVALVAGRTYVVAYGGGSPGASTTQTPYVPVPDSGMTFVEHRQNGNAGVYPAASITTAYGIDPVVRTSIASATPATTGAIRLPNGDTGGLGWRNGADTGNLSLTMNSSDQLALAVGAGSLTTTAPGAGGAGALPATPAGYLTVVLNGTSRRVPYY